MCPFVCIPGRARVFQTGFFLLFIHFQFFPYLPRFPSWESQFIVWIFLKGYGTSGWRVLVVSAQELDGQLIILIDTHTYILPAEAFMNRN